MNERHGLACNQASPSGKRAGWATRIMIDNGSAKVIVVVICILRLL